MEADKVKSALYKLDNNPTLNNFIESFETFVNTPEGYAKLKELILGLAFEGKLVEHINADTNLIEDLIFSSDKIDDKYKYKKGKELKIIDENETFFSIPSHWKWVRIGSIGHNHGQEKPSCKFSYIDVSAINNSTGKIVIPEVLDAASAPSRARKIVRKGTVIYSTVRPYLLNIAIVQDDFDPKPIASTAFAIIHPYDVIDEKYIYYFLRSPKFIEYVESVQKGVAYPAINDEKFYHALFPLAPIEEQKRIVAKVDELMALCDQLEAQQQQQANTLLKANTAAIQALLSSENSKDDLKNNWQRLADNFHTLYGNTLPMPPGEGRQKKYLVGLENLNILRQSIVQLAISGNLVSSVKGDAEKDIDIAIRNKEEIRETRKLRKDNESYEVVEQFTLPNGWVWCNIGQIAHVLGGKRVPRGYKLLEDPTKHVYIRVTDMKNKSVSMTDLRYIDDDIFEQISKYVINKEDVYVTIAGTIGDVGTIPESLDGMNLTENAAKLVFKGIDQRFLVWLISSQYVQKQFKDAVNQMAQPKLSLSSIKHTNIALPPLEEQKCIVSKVDELMMLCDQIEQQLTMAYDQAEKLITATTKALVA